MELSTELLAKCDAREDFPKFVVGTLPEQFAKKVTRPTAEVRKEMGEEVWLRGFAENRINHAATHAYTPKITAERESNDEDSTELPPSVEENGKSAPSGESRMHSENRSIVDTYPDKDTSTKDPKTQAEANLPLDASTLDKLKDAKSLKSRVDDPERPQQRKTGKRRKPAETDDETSGSTNSSHTEKTKVPREEVSTDSTKQLQSATSTADECPKEQQAETASISRSSKVLSVSPRKYGKTPKVLKTPRRSTTHLPPYTPPYARVLLKVKPRNDQHAAHDRRTAHPTQARRRAEKGNSPLYAMCGYSIPVNRSAVVADKKVSAAKQKPAQARVATVRISSKASASDGPSSPMKILARLTKATLRANEKLQTVEQALEEKLSELAEKSAKAEKLRSRCASLRKSYCQLAKAVFCAF
ncbi:unnamed protein product [Phytophthora lilii]|uniref:Unnamed protein product n=1 Tax=Phytophthora lilii TaxID=2077276 RepID=A0A9W6TKS2_9STRA|nr:unnamed protein product [Phytophthora lilii]